MSDPFALSISPDTAFELWLMANGRCYRLAFLFPDPGPRDVNDRRTSPLILDRLLTKHLRKVAA
jgi:hypothetical protein